MITSYRSDYKKIKEFTFSLKRTSTIVLLYLQCKETAREKQAYPNNGDFNLDADFLPPKYSISYRTNSFAPLKKTYNNPNYWISDL
jgi:hypothetical protein